MLVILHSGQTGVERGAHRGASVAGLSVAGFMPLDRRDELGLVPTDVADHLTPHFDRGPRPAVRANVAIASGVLLVVPDAMRAEMLNARALVFPSEWYEGMPMTLLEAFAAGLGVLGSRIGSVEEIVGQLGEGWLTAAGRVEAWSRSLQALTDDQLVDRAGALARTIYVEKHTESAALARLESLYGRAVRREGC